MLRVPSASHTGQAQVRSNGHQGIGIDRPCQLPGRLFVRKFWQVWNLLLQSIRLRLSV